MIETRRLKNVIFLQTILSFVLSRKIIKIYNVIAGKHGNVTVKDFRNYEKYQSKLSKYKQSKRKQLQTTCCVSKIPYLQTSECFK